MASSAGAACAAGGPFATVQTRRTSATTGCSLDGDSSSRCFLAVTRASCRTLWQSSVSRCETCPGLATSSGRSGGVTFASAAAVCRFRSPTAAFSLSFSRRLCSYSNGDDYDNEEDDRMHGRRLYKKKTVFLSDGISTTVGRRVGSGRKKVLGEGGKLSDKIPPAPGVYAIYDKNGALQYVGLSRKVSFSLANHAARLPDLVATVKIAIVDGPDRDALQAGWKSWVEEHVSAGGAVPPGNMQGNNTWKESSRRPPKADLRLTPGAHVPLTVPMETLIGAAIKGTPVIAFIKGTRSSPQCGFSHRVLMALNKEGVDYETVNVLDEEFNPGVREAIKAYSKWPTIPQVFINGELIGGADLLEESVEKGEFKQLLAAIKK
ncbi:hypothetical protein CBR_g22937 [Chara braunii]|uniref:Glutaredoxin domain-containing protein n=1 Tax=Chara braunii TaxID=69332 RepID=A0A388L387_CHABU|nr:hypothetical protein CBR_g22937 [Chara braunii]|eukprot:GBG76718.1 hypothetical protein CBR_g22937 [Chara braunii]